MKLAIIISSLILTVSLFGQRSHHLSFDIESLVRHDKYLNSVVELGYLNSGERFDFIVGLGGRNMFLKTKTNEVTRNGIGIKFDFYYKIKKWKNSSLGIAFRNKVFRNYYRYSYSVNSSTGDESLQFSKGMNWTTRNSQHFFGIQFEYLPLRYLSIKTFAGCIMENYLQLSYISLKNYHPYASFGINASFMLPARFRQ